MTPQPVFVDTNIFVYALTDQDPIKSEGARAVIAEQRDAIVVSTQVLIELFAVATRKLGLDPPRARDLVDTVAGFPTVTTDRALVIDAMEMAEKAQLSIFDSLMVSAARRGRCRVLLTEDLNDGQQFGPLTVRNPFN